MEQAAMYGFPGVVVFLILKEVFVFVKTYRKDNGGEGKPLLTCAECRVAIRKLPKVASDADSAAKILSATDQDGLPLVYVPRSMERAIDRLADNIEHHGKALQKVAANAGKG